MKQINHITVTVMLVMTLGFTTGPASLNADQKTVIFDEGHGQRFLIDRNGALDLSEFSGVLQKEGLLVKSSKEKITKEVLEQADALVISGPFVSYTQSEISAIIEFVGRGRKLCVMLHIGPPVVGLLGKMNVLISKGVVHEQANLIQDKELDFYVTKLNYHELLRGIERFKVYGSWALLNLKNNAEIIAQTSPKAWNDFNRNNKRDNTELQQSLGIAVAGTLGEGKFVVFGDDAIFQNRFLLGENMILGKNLAAWLGSSK